MVLLAAVYFAAAKLSLPLAIPPGYATAVWPPSGIALAALLLLGPRAWPGVWLGAALVNVTIESSWLSGAIIASGNTLEALAGAALIRRDIGVPAGFRRGEDVFRFIGWSALSAAIAASVGMLALAVKHPAAWPELAHNWWTWWQGDACGMVILAPLILSWYGRSTIAWSAPRVVEFMAFGVLLVAAVQVIFGRPADEFSPLARPIMILPFFVWAAFRFGQREVTAAIATVSTLAVWHTLGERGPFAAGSLNQSLLVLLFFICVCLVTGLVISAVLEERAQALRELSRKHGELQQRFGLMVGSVVDYAIFMLSPEGKVESWNAGAARIKGYAADEIVGRHFSAFYSPEDAANGLPRRHLERAAADGRDESEGWRVRKDGSRFWAHVVITAVRDAGGAPIGYCKVTRDLTGPRRAETELLDAKAAAESANRAKSEFLAKMSHELRTPLNSLLILAKLLADNADHSLAPRQVKYAQTIYDAGRDLLALINDVLDLSKIESGTSLTLRIEAVRLDELLDSIEHAFRQIAREKSLQFHVALGEGVPPAIETDPQRLRQILNNLLANAFKFTPQGSVSLRVSQAPEGGIAFAVTDTGIGIDADKREMVFEAFRQADGGTARHFGGTGLGLSISRELARLLGGSISLQSGPAGGCVFTLLLPPSAPPAAQEPATRSAGA